MAHNEDFLRDMDLLHQQAKEAEEDRLALQREYDKSVNEARMKREASQKAANEEHSIWRAERDRHKNYPYTADAEARRLAPLEVEKEALRRASQKYLEEQDGKRRKTSSGGRRMRYKSTRRRGKSTRRRGKTNRRRVKTHRRRHRKH
jgi:hypothetical protein